MSRKKTTRAAVTIAAAAITIGAWSPLASISIAQDTPMTPPSDTDRSPGRMADHPNANDSNRNMSDQMKRDNVAGATAPAADSIRSDIASVTEAALKKDGFDSVVKYLVDADRNRLKNFTAGDKYAAYNNAVDSLQKNWKAKYNHDFDVSDDVKTVLNDQFLQISQGEIGSRIDAAGKKVPSDEPKVDAGTAEALKKSGVAKTDANSEKVFGGDTKKDIGRNIATVVVRAGTGANDKELAVPMIHELPNTWKIDLPDNIDGQKLHDSLVRHIKMIDDDRANWPSDANEAGRIVVRHILTAIMQADTTPVAMR